MLYQLPEPADGEWIGRRLDAVMFWGFVRIGLRRCRLLLAILSLMIDDCIDFGRLWLVRVSLVMELAVGD